MVPTGHLIRVKRPHALPPACALRGSRQNGLKCTFKGVASPCVPGCLRSRKKKNAHSDPAFTAVTVPTAIPSRTPLREPNYRNTMDGNEGCDSSTARWVIREENRLYAPRVWRAENAHAAVGSTRPDGAGKNTSKGRIKHAQVGQKSVSTR